MRTVMHDYHEILFFNLSIEFFVKTSDVVFKPEFKKNIHAHKKNIIFIQ